MPTLAETAGSLYAAPDKKEEVSEEFIQKDTVFLAFNVKQKKVFQITEEDPIAKPGSGIRHDAMQRALAHLGRDAFYATDPVIHNPTPILPANRRLGPTNICYHVGSSKPIFIASMNYINFHTEWTTYGNCEVPHIREVDATQPEDAINPEMERPEYLWRPPGGVKIMLIDDMHTGRQTMVAYFPGRKQGVRLLPFPNQNEAGNLCLGELAHIGADQGQAMRMLCVADNLANNIANSDWFDTGYEGDLDEEDFDSYEDYCDAVNDQREEQDVNCLSPNSEYSRFIQIFCFEKGVQIPLTCDRLFELTNPVSLDPHLMSIFEGAEAGDYTL